MRLFRDEMKNFYENFTTFFYTDGLKRTDMVVIVKTLTAC